MKKYIKRILSAFLVICMLLGIMPIDMLEVQAANDTIYVLAGGDFQEAGDHANSATNVTNILAQVSQKYDTMDGFLFIGDYDCETHDSATETANGITALMGAVQGKYSNLNDANSVLVQGNHDYMDSRIDKTGGHEFEGYSVYVLNEDDYPNGGGSQSQIQSLANNLETWLNNKLGEGYDAPIFITSHLPLAYTPRTVTQGDAKYAKLIFDVLNSAADNGLNIIFMHGHDHAYGPDNYMGGEAIYLPEGDKIAIAESGSTSAFTWETLNFTYMNAGYTGYYSDPYTYVTTAGTDKLTMTVFAIENDQVTVERYSANGLYNLKSEGYDGSYSNTSVTNQSLGLGVNSTVYASPQTIALSEAQDYGDIGSWVGVSAEVTDDVTTSGNDWTTIKKETAAGTRYVYELDKDGIDTGVEYLVVANSYAKALSAAASSNNAVDITIDGNYAYANADTYGWTFTRYSDGVYYIRLNNSTYLRLKNNALSSSTLTGSSRRWTVTSNGDGCYDIVRSNYNLRWSDSNGVFQASASEGPVRLYKYLKTETTASQAGLYGRLEGGLTYNVEAGTSAEAALAKVKEGIAIKYASKADYSDEQEFPDDGEGMTWTLDSNYDPNVPGDYAVTIAYNGTTIGTAEVIVPATTTYYIAEGNGLYIVAMNTTEANALAAVKAGIKVSSATDVNGTNKTTVNEGVTYEWVDKYNGADSGPYTVEILKDGTSLGTVEVKVDIKYETGINSDWTYIGETEATGGTYTYTLDTDGINSGSSNKYIIVARDQAYLLNAGSAVPVTISSDGKTATVNTRDYEYYFTGSTSGLITRDGSNTLYQQNWGIHTGYVEDSNLDRFTNLNSGYYRLYDGDGTQRSLYYNGSSWTVTSENHTSSTYSVRLYKYTGMTGGTPGGSLYALIEGNTVYTVTQGSSATSAMSKVKAGITGYTASAEDGTNRTELSDSDLTWKWKNTFNGNSTGSYWVEISYQGKVLGTVEVRVEPGTVNNYPEYPNEGAVKVNKTGTGIDFQSSGIARVEVSASGIPMKKGADVIIMVDTSSSMKSWCVEHNAQDSCANKRNVVFEAALENLIAQLQKKGEDGEAQDIRVALADFNGFDGYNNSTNYGTPYDREEKDTTNDTAWYSATNQAKVYTGTKGLDSGAFVQATELPTDSADFGFNYVSGTNYDYAFDAIYQLGNSIKRANEEVGTNRDLYVIFMSDGAPMQYNYYHSQGASNVWQYWLTGTVENHGGFSTVVNCQDHTYYYDEENGNKHRMAEAVKGDSSENFEVIRKSTDGLEDVLKATGEDNMYTLPGLGATMYSIAFDPVADGNTPASAMTHVLENIASEQTGTSKYYYLADTADDLENAFTSIGGEIAYAATNARYVDQMGAAFNLQMATANYEVVDGDTKVTKTLEPKIEIISYDIYTRQDFLDGTITEDKIGDRKGTYTILETVTFSADGKAAYSDKIGGGTTNILADGTQAGYVKGVIYAKTFLYNTNATGVAIDGVNIPTGTKTDGTTTGSTNVLPAESFYWKMGTVQTSELAMRYYVYLEGSMEGKREGGSYPTNEYATLYYDNYLGNPCKKETVSPVMPWKEANVSYAFYLVNSNGEIIVNQTTGQTGSFANKIAVTSPVVYETVLLNNDEEVSSIDIASLGVLPEGYTLYDCKEENSQKTGATYTVNINSNTTGSWNITSVKDVATTYVMHYDPENASAYSNDKSVNEIGLDYTHTVVWFAVLWEIQALPDTVVIDYGLPVDISVLTNDMFGENGKLAGIGAYSDSLNLDGHAQNMASGFGPNYSGTYGTATADTKTGKVQYTPSNMEMKSHEKFAYAVNYTGNENAGYYYDTVTVIPATTIYYEDSFVTYNVWDTNSGAEITDAAVAWTQVGTTVESTQAEDRPGQYSLPQVDANNLYGYDASYKEMATYSMGSAKKVTVGTQGSYDTYATAEFTFWGTGFDVVSLTSDKTGTIDIAVTRLDAEKQTTKYYMVDTYYGYKYVDGEWVVDPDADDALYQVPVMKVNNMDYGHYKVVITVVYGELFDHGQYENGYYDFYLDAIRVYDPANDGVNNEVIKDAYVADNEGWPEYFELRNLIISKEDFNAATDVVDGIIFIDETTGEKTIDISDYTDYGPNNEVYLEPGQAIAFDMYQIHKEDLASIQIALKTVKGSEVLAKVYDANIPSENVTTVNTATDMYYDITSLNGKTVVIANASPENSGVILSITNIKVTYKSANVDSLEQAMFTITPETAEVVMLTLRRPVIVEPEIETFTPEVFDVKVSKKDVKVGDKIKLTVKTSADVETLIVNGEVYDDYSVNRRTGDRIWKINLTADTAGEMIIEIVACNEEGTASEPQTVSVTVEAKKKPNKGNSKR